MEEIILDGALKKKEHRRVEQLRQT